MFDFDHPPDRRNSDSEKWARYRGRDVIPMWVADMDFAAPPAVLAAIEHRLQHGVLGYTSQWPSLAEAVQLGLWRDHRWQIAPEWLVWLPGVVSGFFTACQMVEAGAGVCTAAPVYPPLLGAATHTGRRLQRCDLVRTGARWEWDWSALDATLDASSRLLMLCNPHNPVGRAFTHAELTQLGERVLRHDLLLLSDEIHCGLVLDPALPHLPIAALDPELARRSITLMAPSKTWNIPGLGAAFAVIPDATLRRRFQHTARGMVAFPNVLGLHALEAAYREGDVWRRALVQYLHGNASRVVEAVNAMPGLRTTVVEATALAWIDCRDAGLERPQAYFEAAGVGLSDGADFGAPGFVRLNFGCSRSTLETALARMDAAMRQNHA